MPFDKLNNNELVFYTNIRDSTLKTTLLNNSSVQAVLESTVTSSVHQTFRDKQFQNVDTLVEMLCTLPI